MENGLTPKHRNNTGDNNQSFGDGLGPAKNYHRTTAAQVWIHFHDFLYRILMVILCWVNVITDVILSSRLKCHHRCNLVIASHDNVSAPGETIMYLTGHTRDPTPN